MPAGSCQVYGSVSGEDINSYPKYTGSPLLLFLADLWLFLCNIFYLPCIFLPLTPWSCGSLDELYPSLANIFDICLHCVLFVLQLVFLISLPLFIWLPFGVYVLYIVTALALNTLICYALNRGIPADGLRSTEDDFSRRWNRHEDEYWIFLNGICVGRNWLQNNVDRISRTFHRPVVGVHNKTTGVIFDIIQCLIQRCLLYATNDVRDCYVLVRRALYRPEVKKVVLILHSQGGIEGGMILDWLLDEVPQDLIRQLEIYTFGCLANHFNNPYRDTASCNAAMRYVRTGDITGNIHNRSILHIEHYANKRDFACRFGVLNFDHSKPQDRRENRFMGKVLVSPASGHQFNQHYLDTMFPLDPTNRFTREPREGDFMDTDVIVSRHDRPEEDRPVTILDAAGLLDAGTGEVDGTSLNSVLSGSAQNMKVGLNMKLKMHQLSRLWLYRNGGRPVS
ncbi:uncharacterized protein BO88DRAFT_387931 [Aspergillus vadensis CBS 113365]|uniref:Alpha/beta-hydrolase n=1 Tax=Aspergillus vadensis (strain CBS 113365 / IMI 142717 / IBT 24658) TaxID=1448311 RepID=A0A319BAC4_ASPVC|nr:hypothetical protein BO88DRAFT_387931 [Aspergillus vadensis CBS 113365]PYH69647.1 hypothetical protein BO88DRAFT_387931 [Aspergillus vadensis CBS 113365]